MADSRLVNSNETSRAQHIAIQGLPVNPFGQGGPAASMITDTFGQAFGLKINRDAGHCRHVVRRIRVIVKTCISN
jgi:hypothetical protein